LPETLRWIKAGGMPAQAPRPAAPPKRQPKGASFTLHHHAGPGGRRDFMLYRPSAAAGVQAGLPLVVMLHGCTQSPEDFALGTGMNALAEELGVLVAYPAQPQAANMQRCWNWFNPADQGRGAGEPALIAALAQTLLAGQPADPARVYIAGLSAGGAAATVIARAYPDVFAAAGVHSGLPAGAAGDVGAAFAAMRNGAQGVKGGQAVPTIIFHGDADDTVHPANGAGVARQALSGFPPLSVSVTQGRAGRGRSFSRTSHQGDDGRSMVEHWSIKGAGHAWSGGQAAGSYTDPTGPDASREFLRFFLQHRRG
jgi:poly(hydroxyalkanoate) depolymerase family esterase